ncbi:hypothetical protein ANCDUO_09401 [Ancylostoma duodenale]|uniref:Uncharacterized protein n=1 Tax=Ancylostoma duodenale TaxID=51022 RepID=A0A0C2GGR4_9BILA|nr:hypothetical protein ANCDUO_09401 [Ancylostoma duodenale]
MYLVHFHYPQDLRFFSSRFASLRHISLSRNYGTNVCTSTPHGLREICERFETRVVHELFLWIVKMEQRIEPGRDCTFLHFCPTLTTQPPTTTETQPPTTTGHGFIPFF